MGAGTTFDSAAYWRERYRDGRTSGSGSYGRLSVYKAHVVNVAVHRHRIRSLVEFGSGDGNQASLFAIRRYTGIDVSGEAVAACRARFADRPDWRFLTAAEFAAAPQVFDAAMSLDVIYHLVEDSVFDAYMRQLFGAARRLVIVYATDHDEAGAQPHVRHRAYSGWIASHAPDWRLAETVPQPFPRTETSNPRHTALAFFNIYERAA